MDDAYHYTYMRAGHMHSAIFSIDLESAIGEMQALIQFAKTGAHTQGSSLPVADPSSAAAVALSVGDLLALCLAVFIIVCSLCPTGLDASTPSTKLCGCCCPLVFCSVFVVMCCADDDLICLQHLRMYAAIRRHTSRSL